MKIKEKYQQQPDLNDSLWTNPWHFIACAFGVGAMPLAPGTFGTLVGLLFALIMIQLGWVFYIIFTLIMIVVGVWLCDKVSKDMGMHDHSGMAWDEVATFPLVMIGVPFHWYWLLLGFVLFRVIDIWKPGPIAWLDKNVHGGFGMMIDDVAAAAVAWLILFIVSRMV